MWKWIAGSVAAFAAVVAVGLWAISEPEIPRSVLEAKYATPPSQFAVLADGTRMHYRDRGPRDAPVLILLHGFSGSLFVWEQWARTLSSAPEDSLDTTAPPPDTKIVAPSDPNKLDLRGGSYLLLDVHTPKGADRRKLIQQAITQTLTWIGTFRVISLDLPGHGLTGATPKGDYSQAAMTQSVKDFADKLGLKQFALAGNSMGGGVAARFAEMYPGRVTHLILIDAAGARTSTRPRLHLAYIASSVPVVDRFFLHEVMRRMPDMSRMQGSPQAILEHFRLPDDSYVWDHVKAITAPTLIMWGGEDRTIPIAGAYAWRDAIAGSKLIIYPHAGHVSMADAPAASIRDAREFLKPHLHYEIRMNNLQIDRERLLRATAPRKP